MIVNRNKGVKGHTNFGNHIETGSSNRFDTTNMFKMQEQRTLGTMAQNIRIHVMTRHKQLKGIHKVYFYLQYSF